MGHKTPTPDARITLTYADEQEAFEVLSVLLRATAALADEDGPEDWCSAATANEVAIYALALGYHAEALAEEMLRRFHAPSQPPGAPPTP